MDLDLLLTFLNVIFPLQHAPYERSSSSHQTSPSPQWLAQTIIQDEALYHATASISAVLTTSRPPNLTALLDTSSSPHRELTPSARMLQSKALRCLQHRIDDLSSKTYHGQELVQRCMQALAIMTELVSLDIFTLNTGQWQMHLYASRALLGMFQNKWAPELFTPSSTPFTLHPPVSIAHTTVLRLSTSPTNPQPSYNDNNNNNKNKDTSYSPSDLQALEFFITSFIWIDIIANATFGPPPLTTTSTNFTYLPSLHAGLFQPSNVMGCRSCIMISITEITHLERWRDDHLAHGTLSIMALAARATFLNDAIETGIREIETALTVLRQRGEVTDDVTDVDGGQVNIIFAHAALVYLHTVVSGAGNPAIKEIKQNVERCIARIEELPAHCVIRITWPMTISGCMATGGDVQRRFAAVLRRTVERGEQLGSTWKGLKVMEECWRLRVEEPDGRGWDCRRTMERMGMKILLI
jgi:hypothetical protein